MTALALAPSGRSSGTAGLPIALCPHSRSSGTLVDRAVAVKKLKSGYSDKARKLLVAEANLMKQVSSFVRLTNQILEISNTTTFFALLVMYLARASAQWFETLISTDADSCRS